MTKKILFLIGLLVAVFFATESFAQMINYDRLNKRRGTTAPTTPPKAGTSKATSPQVPDQSNLPTWLVTPPKVTSKVEESYDINHDKKLQSAEIKMFLRDVIDEINDKGGYTVNSDILKQFDKNKDGIISRLELADLEKLVR